MTHTITKILTAWLVAFSLLVPGVGLGGQRDPGAAPNPYLASLMDDLDKLGIDVLNSWDSPGARDIPLRPALSSLDGFELNPEPDEAPKAWMRDFATGNAGALLMVKHEGPAVDIGIDEMRERWLAAEPDKRVFLSFTRQDAIHAANVRAAWEARGFLVFTYINEPGSTPPFDPHEVGAFFKQAGHHFVLDSTNARRSDGVFFEAKMLHDIKRPEKKGPLARRVYHVYGRMNCPRTIETILDYEAKGAHVVFHDVETSKAARARAGSNDVPVVMRKGKKIQPPKGTCKSLASRLAEIEFQVTFE